MMIDDDEQIDINVTYTCSDKTARTRSSNRKGLIVIEGSRSSQCRVLMVLVRTTAVRLLIYCGKLAVG